MNVSNARHNDERERVFVGTVMLAGAGHRVLSLGVIILSKKMVAPFVCIACLLCVYGMYTMCVLCEL